MQVLPVAKTFPVCNTTTIQIISILLLYVVTQVPVVSKAATATILNQERLRCDYAICDETKQNANDVTRPL
jgi:hypothetical protein